MNYLNVKETNIIKRESLIANQDNFIFKVVQRAIKRYVKKNH